MSPAHQARMTPAPTTPWFGVGSRGRSRSGSTKRLWSLQGAAAMADFGITEDTTPQKVSRAIAAVSCSHTNGHQVRSDAVVCKPMAIHKIDYYDQHTEDLVKDHPGADIQEAGMAADGAEPIAKRLRLRHHRSRTVARSHLYTFFRGERGRADMGGRGAGGLCL